MELPGDILFVEDYAHHPAEIRATLAADAMTERRRVVVFQPHRFSRTRALERDFATCFSRADGLIERIVDLTGRHVPLACRAFPVVFARLDARDQFYVTALTADLQPASSPAAQAC